MHVYFMLTSLVKIALMDFIPKNYMMVFIYITTKKGLACKSFFGSNGQKISALYSLVFVTQSDLEYFHSLEQNASLSQDDLPNQRQTRNLLSTTRRICPKYGEIQTGMYFFCIHRRPGTMDIECD